MEAIIQAKKLREQVGALQGIIDRKGTIPMLAKIKIDASESGDLTMTATDLDVSLIIEQEVDILRPGSICLSGKKLGDITAGLPNEPVHLKLDDAGEKVELRAGRFVSRLSGTDSDQFPEIAPVNSDSLNIQATFLYEGLRRTAFAASDDKSRFALNCVLLKIENSVLRMVSTDGHRLCHFRVATTAGRETDLQCLIPSKAVRELKNLLADELRINKQAEVKIKKGAQLEFQIGNKRMTARETTETFPNWEMVVPKSFKFFAEINAQELREALLRAGVMTDDSHRRVKFVFYPNKVLLKSESSEVGSSVEEVRCNFHRIVDETSGSDLVAEVSDESWQIAFNTRYLMDFFAIHSSKSEEARIVWKFAGSEAQSELTFEGEERLFSYILVPLKL